MENIGQYVPAFVNMLFNVCNAPLNKLILFHVRFLKEDEPYSLTGMIIFCRCMNCWEVLHAKADY